MEVIVVVVVVAVVVVVVVVAVVVVVVVVVVAVVVVVPVVVVVAVVVVVVVVVVLGRLRIVPLVLTMCTLVGRFTLTFERRQVACMMWDGTQPAQPVAPVTTQCWHLKRH
jgi:hypothetical protein